ncbi:hypothetical protein VEx25_0609 [Vibrio antiquarius]|uniref:Uncharacterized protein n=1 Tax=Vibrio antiquarius (strain Ex25) TaxID=150340 RepID=A0ABM9WSK6_VIBAE|nr:hypothetical protein VEx25_0609 [Vibrio antiquarius]
MLRCTAKQYVKTFLVKLCNATSSKLSLKRKLTQLALQLSLL